jgi:hypothetical protein
MKRWLVNLPKKYFATAHILWAVVVFGLHAMPSNTFPKISFWQNLGPDKLLHAFMFFIASSLALFSGWSRMKSAVIWICAGVLLEYYQFYFTTDRSFDWFDVMADTTGVFIALMISKGIVLNRG